MLQLISKTEFLCISLQYIMQRCKSTTLNPFAKGRTSQQNSTFSLYCQKKKRYIAYFLLVVILTFISSFRILSSKDVQLYFTQNSIVHFLLDIFILLDIACILNTFIHTFKYIFKMHFKREPRGSAIVFNCRKQNPQVM